MDSTFGLRNLANILIFVFTALQTIQGGVPPIKETRDLDCYKDGVAYIKDIPHPTNCKAFLSCNYMSGGAAGVYAKTMNCVSGTEFSMKTCRCEFPYSEDADCFNMSNPVHVETRMKCAEVAQPRLFDSSEEDFGAD